ncbi:class I SAM-dependent methyltransferase [Propionibacteriaceae bacterium Y1700]|uniref:class I SAM-dependent methyltransferase n=1 Tax=Microlunatus sp. Y1700 TaxID=3418487 RepID=UPI003DA76C39
MTHATDGDDTGPATPIRSIHDVPGWFFWRDQSLFRWFLEAQQESEPGTLVELGAFQGKSAVLIGEHLRSDERFVVVDLFDRVDLLDEDDELNRREMAKSYKTLSQQGFEDNYLALHDDLPEVVCGLSSTVVDHVEPGSVRFMHIDASHYFAPVAEDIANAKRLMRPGGIVVLDDFRAEHCPGVAAAAWGAVATLGLIPVALTDRKMYAVFSEPEWALAVLDERLAADDRFWVGVEDIAGHPVRRLGESTLNKERRRDQAEAARIARKTAEEAAAAAEAARLAEEEAARERAVLAEQQARDRLAARTPRGIVRRVARSVTPPIVSKGIRRVKRRFR